MTVLDLYRKDLWNLDDWSDFIPFTNDDVRSEPDEDE